MSSFPPTGKEWMEGKTAATVRFVEEAEAALETRADLDEGEVYQLQTHVEMLKEGQTALVEFETLDDWLERLRDHYP